VKTHERWYSERLGRSVSVTRWGELGLPVLLFPTAGGDSEEIERFLVIATLRPLLEAGKLKIYSCDSVAGRAMLAGEGTARDRMALLNRFQEFVYHEVVPAVRADCRSPGIEITAAGSSIGAYNALAVLCRYPDVFDRALCMSGTYDMTRFLGSETTQDFYFASPLHYLPALEGAPLERLRRRFVLLASGEGEAEDIGESWRVADVLGGKGIPNRVESWGAEWDHDWPLWRNMLRTYLGDWTGWEG
jgi:esterase/lipase superfamily enzyme